MNEITSVKIKGFKSGLSATFPLAPGVMAFGFVYGSAARKVGLTIGQAWLMSLSVFAGAAQFSALQVWAAGSAGVIILVASIVNLRYFIMSASIAPYLLDKRWYHKMAAAFMLSDESYALAMSQFVNGEGSFSYLMGANLGLYIQWAVACLAGSVLEIVFFDLKFYRLDLVFPLAFLGMLVPLIRDRITLIVVLMAGLLALGGAVWLPGKWYILLAGLGASSAGVLLEKLWKHY